MMLFRARDNNIQSFAYIWLHKGNQNEFLKHPKIKSQNFEYYTKVLNFVARKVTHLFSPSTETAGSPNCAGTAKRFDEVAAIASGSRKQKKISLCRECREKVYLYL